MTLRRQLVKKITFEKKRGGNGNEGKIHGEKWKSGNGQPGKHDSAKISCFERKRPILGWAVAKQ